MREVTVTPVGPAVQGNPSRRALVKADSTADFADVPEGNYRVDVVPFGQPPLPFSRSAAITITAGERTDARIRP